MRKWLLLLLSSWAKSAPSATIYAHALLVKSTATLYPELGGPAMRKKYENLFKAIQKALEQ